MREPLVGEGLERLGTTDLSPVDTNSSLQNLDRVYSTLSAFMQIDYLEVRQGMWKGTEVEHCIAW